MDKRGTSKKAQVTIFIIIAVVMVAIVLTIILVQRAGKAPQAEVQEVKAYLDSCFEEKGKQAIIDTAKQGFYYELPENKIIFLEEQTAYYFKDGENLVPTSTIIEQELALAMNEAILPCLAFSQFQSEYEITHEDCSPQATLTDDSVKFSIACPITIKKAGATYSLENFDVNIFCNAKKLINASRFIIEKYMLDYTEDPNFICLTCLEEIAEANQVTMTIVPIVKEVFIPEHVWFIIRDKQGIDDKELTLRFVTD